MPRRLITERHVVEAARADRTEITFAAGTLVTALTRDAARAWGVRLVEASRSTPASW